MKKNTVIDPHSSFGLVSRTGFRDTNEFTPNITIRGEKTKIDNLNTMLIESTGLVLLVLTSM